MFAYFGGKLIDGAMNGMIESLFPKITYESFGYFLLNLRTEVVFRLYYRTADYSVSREKVFVC